MFPGVLGKATLKRRKRTKVEKTLKKQEQEVWDRHLAENPDYDPDDPGHLEFDMGEFLRRCQFPEFRSLFRANDLYPFSDIKKIKDLDMMDTLTENCQAQVFKIFPVLDMLDTGGSFVNLINPANYIRILKNMNAIRRGERRPADPDSIKDHELATRYEEIEVDDKSKDLPAKWFDRDEPLPWGTLRLKVNAERTKLALLESRPTKYVFSSTHPLNLYLLICFSREETTG